MHSLYLSSEFFILKENIFENEVLNAWLTYIYSFQLQMEHWNMLTRGTWLFKNGTQLFSCAHNYTVLVVTWYFITISHRKLYLRVMY